LENSPSTGWICCDGRRQRELPRGTRIEVRESRDTLHLARLSGVPFTNRLVSKFNLPVVGWRDQDHHADHAADKIHTDGSIHNDSVHDGSVHNGSIHNDTPGGTDDAAPGCAEAGKR
jgi:NAD+ kinase